MKKFDLINNKVMIFALIVVLTILLFALAHLLIIKEVGYRPKPDWEPARATHKVVDDNSLEILWIRPDVYIAANNGNSNLAASGGKAFLLGGIDIEESDRVIALDILTGEIVWKSDPKPFGALFADQEGVYVGQSGGGGRISKFDPDTGKVQWSRSFWYASGVLHLIVYEEQLHAYLAPDKHRILRPSDGKTIFSIFPKGPPFFDSRVCREILDTPIYTSDTVYYRTDRIPELSKVCAVDISTGELRWKSDLKAISNLAVTEDAVFMLVENGELLALDPATGEEISSLNISLDKPFVLYTSQAEYPYYVAYDDEYDILLVYLGDSRQLFSFQIGKK